MEIPMLEEHEWQKILPDLAQGGNLWRRHLALDRYNKITGFDETNARAFDEKVESLIVDSHDSANRIQDPHWCKGGQS
jgi:hypothetical protein